MPGFMTHQNFSSESKAKASFVLREQRRVIVATIIFRDNNATT